MTKPNYQDILKMFAKLREQQELHKQECRKQDILNMIIDLKEQHVLKSMGQSDSKLDYSYHIEQKFGRDYIPIWPASGFGDYCTNKSEALNQYKKEQTNVCRVVRYKSVIQNGIVIGCVEGTEEIVQ